MYAILIVALSVALLSFLIMKLRFNAFFSLVITAIFVGVLSGLSLAEAISLTTTKLGASIFGIAVVIGLAVVSGQIMDESGAAEKIARSILRLTGQEKAPFAMIGTGYLLSIPLFSDTSYYLLIPIARALASSMVVLKIHQENEPTVMLFTEAGFIGGKGINSTGVSLLLNALFVGYEKDAVPLHIKMRAALDGTNISQAYSNAANGPTGTGGNLMLGCDGAAISEELTLHEVDGILPINGIITHTNHILSPRLQHIPDYFRTNGSSFLRLCRADELLKGKKNIDQSYIRSVFSDHAGYPLGLCTHPIADQPDWMQYSTNYTVIFDNTEKKAYFCAGNPCEGEFKELGF